MVRFRNTNYYVTDKGLVINSKTGKSLKIFLNGCKYYYSMLTIEGRIKKFYTHRLIAECYLENPKNKPQVNHIDGNKLNNNFSNLEWVTRQENMTHAKENGLMCTNFRPASAKLNKQEVKEIKEMYKNGMTTRQIAEKVKVGKSSVHLIVSGQSYKHLYK